MWELLYLCGVIHEVIFVMTKKLLMLGKESFDPIKDKKIIKQKWEHLKGDETFQRCFLAFKNSLEKHLPMSVFNF